MRHNYCGDSYPKPACNNIKSEKILSKHNPPAVNFRQCARDYRFYPSNPIVLFPSLRSETDVF